MPIKQLLVLTDAPPSSKVEKFRSYLLKWYETNGRQYPWRKTPTTNYQYIIAEILLQRTRADTVAKFYPTFIRELSSWKQLNQINIDEMERRLQPIGLWRRRAYSIKSLAREIVKRKGRFPRTRSEIESLPGVGQYIANAVLLFCHGEPQPLLDVNMSRVLERVFGSRKKADIRYDPYLQALALDVVNCTTPITINWAILDFASIICLPRNARCNECPLSIMCQYNQGNMNVCEHG